MKKLFWGIVVLLLVSQVANAASYDPSLKWKTLTSDHFNIHYDEKLEPQVKQVAVYLEEAYQKLSKKFDWRPWGKTEVIFTDNIDAANGLSSTLPYNYIVLRAASPTPDSVLADYDNWLRTLTFHEYTHIMHIDQYGGIVTPFRYVLGKIISPNGTAPGWMREGIATYIETVETTAGRGRASYPEMMIRTAILNNEFPHIDEADGLQWKWPSYQSMYMYGVKFLQYIADRFGEDKLIEFQHEMGRSLALWAVNHQARNVFGDIQWESKKVGNHYTKVKKEGTPFSKTFYTYWKDWKAELEVKYKTQAAELEKKGLTKLEYVSWVGTVLTHPVASPDGKYLVYARQRLKEPNEVRLIDLETGVDKKIIWKKFPSSLAFSPDSKKIAYSVTGGYKTYNAFSDIYTYDVETKKTEQLTKGARATDPAYSPDGKKIVFVKQDAGRSWLAVYDVEKKELSDIISPFPPLEKGGEGGFEQFANPAWSPDGSRIAFVSWQSHDSPPLKKVGEGGFVPYYDIGEWNLYTGELSDDRAKIIKQVKLTNDRAIESHPVWSADSKALYFSSDRSGINNIYKIDFKGLSDASHQPLVTSHQTQVTNVLTGAFQPTLSPDGKTLYVQYYNGNGFDIRKTSLEPVTLVGTVSEVIARKGDSSLTLGTGSAISSHQLISGDRHVGRSLPSSEAKGPPRDDSSTPDLQFKTKKYSPFGKSLFLPRFIIPSGALLDNAVIMGLFTGGTDPLRRHNWLGGADWRTDLPSFIGYNFNYWYTRYRSNFAVGIMDYAVNFGNLSFRLADGTLDTVHYYEGRRRLYGGYSYPWKNQAFGLQYIREYRRPVVSMLQEESGALNTGNFGGFTMIYAYNVSERYPASISSERGGRVRANFTINDSLLGSAEKNQQRIFVGDGREYISLPWAEHVLALRLSGGITWGRKLVQGSFSLGGALGEGTLGGGGSLYYFPLRGLPIASLSGERTLLASMEYRIPLYSPQRGLGTTPFYIQNIHLAPFADYGNAWAADSDMVGNGKYFFNNFMLGTGAEIRGDFILGHGLPVTGRFGYGIIVVNRDRLGSVKDPILDNLAKYGVMVLQLGTAF